MHEIFEAAKVLDDLVSPGYLVFFAACLQAAALLFRDQIRIRILLLLGSVVYLIYYAVAVQAPLWEAMAATVAMSVANLYGLTALLLSRTACLIPPSQAALFSMFGGVEPGEFRALMKHGQIRTLHHDEALTLAGKVPDRLYFVIEGEVEIEQGQGRFSIPPRHFVGEVSLMLGTPASATAHVKAGVQLVEWSRDHLVQIMARKPKLKTAVESLLGRDMARKVAANAGRIDRKYMASNTPIEHLIG